MSYEINIFDGVFIHLWNLKRKQTKKLRNLWTAAEISNYRRRRREMQLVGLVDLSYTVKCWMMGCSGQPTCNPLILCQKIHTDSVDSNKTLYDTSLKTAANQKISWPTPHINDALKSSFFSDHTLTDIRPFAELKVVMLSIPHVPETDILENLDKSKKL